MLMICAVFTVYFTVLLRNIWKESDVRVLRFCMQTSASECEGVLHGHVPLMSMSHKSSSCVCVDVVVSFSCQTSLSSHKLDVQK